MWRGIDATLKEAEDHGIVSISLGWPRAFTKEALGWPHDFIHIPCSPKPLQVPGRHQPSWWSVFT